MPISPACIFCKYLDPPKTITKAQIAQSDVYRMWAYASKYALESTLQNTKSKLVSKGIKSQKAPEITELESSTDCKKIEANIKYGLSIRFVRGQKHCKKNGKNLRKDSLSNGISKQAYRIIKAIKHMKKIKKMGQFPYLSPFSRLQISIDYNPH